MDELKSLPSFLGFLPPPPPLPLLPLFDENFGFSLFVAFEEELELVPLVEEDELLSPSFALRFLVNLPNPLGDENHFDSSKDRNSLFCVRTTCPLLPAPAAVRTKRCGNCDLSRNIRYRHNGIFTKQIMTSFLSLITSRRNRPSFFSCIAGLLVGCWECSRFLSAALAAECVCVSDPAFSGLVFRTSEIDSGDVVEPDYFQIACRA